jgi:hypothetical protein
MNIINVKQKGRHMNTLERYYIYLDAMKNNHLNDQHTVVHNRIFETIRNNIDDS